MIKIIDGREVEIALLGDGDLIGEGGFLKDQPHTATCRALTPCAIYELKRRDLDASQSSRPGLLAALERAILKRTGDEAKREPASDV